METSQRTYLSYLLRLWHEGGDDEIVWRASLESVQTGERRHFVDEGHLFDLPSATDGSARQIGAP